MAANFARIFGTEEDRVNCTFYFKTGTCRHGDRCSRQHLRPNFSQTILVPHLYMLPSQNIKQDPRDHYEEFYEEILEEFLKFGSVEKVMVCDNLGEHIIGNVFVKYVDEDDAAKALIGISGRFYAGRMLTAEYSPVTDFKAGTCQQFEERSCQRGGYCNFLHFKPVPRFARKFLRRGGDRRRRSRSRSKGRKGYRKFPIRGTSEERRSCISSWNRERERRLREIERIQGSRPKEEVTNNGSYQSYPHPLPGPPMKK